MKALFFALTFLCSAARASECPVLEGTYFCFSSTNQLGLTTTKIRDDEGRKFLELDFGNKILPISIPVGGEAVEIDEDTIVKSSCPTNKVLRTEIHVKSEPTIVPVRELRSDGQGRLRVVDFVAGTSPLAARPPKVAITCDKVLF